MTAILQVPDMGLTEALEFAERQRQLALRLAEDLAALLLDSAPEPPETDKLSKSSLAPSVPPDRRFDK